MKEGRRIKEGKETKGETKGVKQRYKTLSKFKLR